MPSPFNEVREYLMITSIFEKYWLEAKLFLEIVTYLSKLNAYSIFVLNFISSDIRLKSFGHTAHLHLDQYYFQLFTEEDSSSSPSIIANESWWIERSKLIFALVVVNSYPHLIHGFTSTQFHKLNLYLFVIQIKPLSERQKAFWMVQKFHFLLNIHLIFNDVIVR